VKQKRFTGEQIAAVLKQGEAGVSVCELIRRVGISEQTYYRWKKQYIELTMGWLSYVVLKNKVNDMLSACGIELKTVDLRRAESLHISLHSFAVLGNNALYLQLITNTRIALKIRWSQVRVGSTPSSGTIFFLFPVGLTFPKHAFTAAQLYQSRHF
jgi:hypothetical protein